MEKSKLRCFGDCKLRKYPPGEEKKKTYESISKNGVILAKIRVSLLTKMVLFCVANKQKHLAPQTRSDCEIFQNLAVRPPFSMKKDLAPQTRSDRLRSLTLKIFAIEGNHYI
jgi:hypothetical protein